MFIGFIYVIGVFTLSTAIFGSIEAKIEKDEEKAKKKKFNNENKLKSVNRYWTDIDVK
jgi:hypothetical protein